jgi:hypothetical protein
MPVIHISMEYGHWFRRGFHFCAPLFLVYYLIPRDLWGIGFFREAMLLAVFVVVMVIEALRLAKGKVFFGLRDYEKGQLSAYAWAAIGITVAFLFFLREFVICAVWGMGWTDPLIGELRRHWKKGYPAIPLVTYFLLTFTLLRVFSEIALPVCLLLAAVGSAVAIAVEYPKIRHVDDDFLMLIVPLVAVTATYWALGMAGIV